ncbi:MAG: hypothetical protein AAF225_04425 [Pseudomonadota bacterium]
MNSVDLARVPGIRRRLKTGRAWTAVEIARQIGGEPGRTEDEGHDVKADFRQVQDRPPRR